jgi:hypothetical protein
MARTGSILLLALVLQACGDGNGGGPECNNSVLEEGEQCDGDQLGGETCEGRGYFTGDLACTDQCTFDQSGCSNCGNGTWDEGEWCDGQDLNGKDCRDLGYHGGDLACKDNCTFNGEGCYACGNNVIEMDEECDREEFGLRTCKTEGYDGGDLLCTDNCVIDESQCYDCGGSDPCEGQICSGHGRCRVDNCVPYCECDDGYTPGVDLTCLEEGSCGLGGEECTQGDDCCLGLCRNFGGATSYCAEVGCQNHSECVNHGDDGRDMCCVWGPEANYCMKTAAAGVSCGDRTGTCGAHCAGTLGSACAEGNSCIYLFEDDPAPLCGSQCIVDADCSACTDDADPGAVFECVEVEWGSACVKQDEACADTSECQDGEVCSLILNQDQTAYEGVCYDHGGMDTGAECDWDWHSYDERCTSLLCTQVSGSETGRCSEHCQVEADCPVDMLCSHGAFCVDTACTTMLPVDLCLWMPGSQSACVYTGDCPAGEVCTYRQAAGGLLDNRCTTEACTPTAADCGDVGDACGEGHPPCAGKLCLDDGTDWWCSALCDQNAHCPAGMYCGPMEVDAQVQGVCKVLSGSLSPCTTNADCAGAGEACMPIEMIAGVQTVCITPLPTDPLCSMCTVDADCGGDSVCIASLANPGEHYCGLPCPNGDECPQGYACTDVGGAVNNCMPEDDSCLTD